MLHERVTIEGMGCMHCVEAVRSSLEAIGIRVHAVDIGSAEVSYDTEQIDRSMIDDAIKDAGYKATGRHFVEDQAS